MGKTRDFHYASINDPQTFWRHEAGRIHWDVARIRSWTLPDAVRTLVGDRPHKNLWYSAVDRRLSLRVGQAGAHLGAHRSWR